MFFEISASLVAAVLSIVAAGLASTPLARDVIGFLLGRPPVEEKSYSEKLAELTKSLTQASQQVDLVLSELSSVTQRKERAALDLAAKLTGLEGEELKLRERVAALQDLQLPAVEHFAKIIGSGEKRSARRDYLLFGAGVVVSTAIAIGLKLAGLA